MLPLALANGASSQMLRPIAIAVIGGILIFDRAFSALRLTRAIR
jgi:Cu/Ag efflux pump CusA